jgi:hypothetical protein
VAALFLPVVAGSAAAGPSEPTVTVTKAVTGTSVALAIGVDRGVQQIASCTYVVDTTAPSSCGTKTSQGKKAASYAVNLTNQAVGEHTVTVTVRLTDGGRGTGATSFTIAAPPADVFARAWRDVDQVAGFHPSLDELYSELVDTNGSAVLDVGDTIRVYAHPSDFAGNRVTALVTSHTVTFVASAPADQVAVTAASGDFVWATGPVADGYQEVVPGSASTIIVDSYSSDDPDPIFQFDTIQVQSASPSQPDAPVASTKPRDGDDFWFEVSIALS